MPARLNPRHQQMVRDKIQASALITRLTRIAKGEVVAEGYQVTAALGLLKKVLPDLTATDLSTGGEALNVQLIQYGASGAQGVAIGAKRAVSGRKAARNIMQVEAKTVPCDITLPAPRVIPDREPSPLVSLSDSSAGAKIEG